MQPNQRLKEQLRVLEEERDHFHTLYLNHLKLETSSLQYKVSYVTLKEKYDKLNKEYLDLLNSNNISETKFACMLTVLDSSFETKGSITYNHFITIQFYLTCFVENELQIKLQDLPQKFATEKEDLEKQFKKQLSESYTKLKQITTLNNQLQCENVALQTRSVTCQEDNQISANLAKQIDYYKNLLSQRDSKIHDLKEKLREKLIKSSRNISTND